MDQEKEFEVRVESEFEDRVESELGSEFRVGFRVGLRVESEFRVGIRVESELESEAKKVRRRIPRPDPGIGPSVRRVRGQQRPARGFTWDPPRASKSLPEGSWEPPEALLGPSQSFQQSP